MPPRTGPRRKRRMKQATLLPRHFTIVRAAPDAVTDVFVLSVELAGGCLVLRDQAGAIIHIIADGEWREIRPLDVPAQAEEPALSTFANPTPGEALRAFEAATESREQATLVAEGDNDANDAVVSVSTSVSPAIPPEEDRFVPSSPEEAQRILMEIHRRLAPDHQDPPDAPAAPPPLPRKD